MQNFDRPESHQQRDEDDLVQLARNGDGAAFAELARRTYTQSLKVATSILRDRAEAEDQVQNALANAFQHIAQFLAGARFSTWMTRIVVNQCLMRLRSLKRSRLLHLDEPCGGTERVVVELADTGASPEHALAVKEIGELLQREIRRIPPLLRTVFLLREVDELPIEEVANRLGITVPAAKSRLLRARAELRVRLSAPSMPFERC